MLFTINGNANILKETAAVTNWLRKAKDALPSVKTCPIYRTNLIKIQGLD